MTNSQGNKIAAWKEEQEKYMRESPAPLQAERIFLSGENFDVIETPEGPAIRLNVGGHVIVATAAKLHEAARRSETGRTGWIPVGERLPPPYKTVLLDCDGELKSTGHLKNDGKFLIDAEHESDGSHWIVTHWQELLTNAATQYRMGESPRDASGNSPASNASSGDLAAVAAPINAGGARKTETGGDSATQPTVPAGSTAPVSAPCVAAPKLTDEQHKAMAEFSDLLGRTHHKAPLPIASEKLVWIADWFYTLEERERERPSADKGGKDG